MDYLIIARSFVYQSVIIVAKRKLNYSVWFNTHTAGFQTHQCSICDPFFNSEQLLICLSGDLKCLFRFLVASDEPRTKPSSSVTWCYNLNRIYTPPFVVTCMHVGLFYYLYVIVLPHFCIQAIFFLAMLCLCGSVARLFVCFCSCSWCS